MEDNFPVVLDPGIFFSRKLAGNRLPGRGRAATGRVMGRGYKVLS